MEPPSPSTAAAADPTDLAGAPPPAAAPRRRALVVLGMHRSGTSAVAGVLQRIGVDFGPRLMPATAANERGYYEHIDVVNLHDRLLMALDRGWDSLAPWPPAWWEDEARTGRFRAELLVLLRRDFGAAPLWGVKDPRLCLLLPWWRPLWAVLNTEPVFVIVVRDPREVAVSLRRREGISEQKTWVLWREHLLAAERETRGSARHFLRYEDFLHGWEASLAPLERHLGAAWRGRLAAARRPVAEFLDGSLRRAASPGAGKAALPPWLEDAAGALAAACAPDGQAPPAGLLDAIREQPPATRRDGARAGGNPPGRSDDRTCRGPQAGPLVRGRMAQGDGPGGEGGGASRQGRENGQIRAELHYYKRENAIKKENTIYRIYEKNGLFSGWHLAACAEIRDAENVDESARTLIR